MSGSLGSGRVEYSADRPIIHFGTSPQVAESTIALDRLRASGFLIAAEKKEATS